MWNKIGFNVASQPNMSEIHYFSSVPCQNNFLSSMIKLLWFSILYFNLWVWIFTIHFYPMYYMWGVAGQSQICPFYNTSFHPTGIFSLNFTSAHFWGGAIYYILLELQGKGNWRYLGKVMPQPGIEPGTFQYRVGCSCWCPNLILLVKSPWGLLTIVCTQNSHTYHCHGWSTSQN